VDDQVGPIRSIKCTACRSNEQLLPGMRVKDLYCQYAVHKAAMYRMRLP
jgi:hypothetical protein